MSTLEEYSPGDHPIFDYIKALDQEKKDGLVFFNAYTSDLLKEKVKFIQALEYSEHEDMSIEEKYISYKTEDDKHKIYFVPYGHHELPVTEGFIPCVGSSESAPIDVESLSYSMALLSKLATTYRRSDLHSYHLDSSHSIEGNDREYFEKYYNYAYVMVAWDGKKRVGSRGYTFISGDSSVKFEAACRNKKPPSHEYTNMGYLISEITGMDNHSS